MKQHVKRLSALGIGVLVALTPLAPGFSAWAADANTLHISSGSEFKEFAQKCAVDTYSQGLTVVLDRDIDLAGYGSVTVPVFCGTFDGGHHTISGYNSLGKGSDRGLFRYVKPGASITSLTVSGSVAPEGTKSGLGLLAGRNEGTIRSCAAEGTVTGDESIGGLVGVNEKSGVIRDCVSRVTVTGSTNAGGIAGRSDGTISGCVNEGTINTDGDQAPTNTGGITGKSTGLIENCKNTAEIGYQHVGYNTGGIVGSQNGVVTGCTNSGKIYGRKDVGGIVGQFEPYVNFTYGTSPIDALDQALDQLSSLMSQLADQVSSAAGGAIDDFKVMNDAMNSIRDTAHSAGTEAIEDADVMIGDVHTAAQSINHALSGLIDDTDAFIQETSGNLDEVNRQLKKVRKNLMDVPYTLTNGITTATEEVDTATSKVQNNIQQAIDELNGAKNDLRKLATFSQTVSDILLGGGSAEDKLNDLVSALEDLGKIDPSARVERARKAMQDAVDAVKLMTDNVKWGISQSNTEIQVALRDANNALKKLENLASTINSDTAAYSSNAMNSLRQVNGHVSTIENTLRSYTSTLGDKGQKTMDDVDSQLTIINDRVGQMTDGAASTNTDLHATTQSIITTMSTVEDAIKNLVKVPEKTVDDISKSQGDSGPGRVISCKNTGAIQADSNVGGIAGMIAPELDIDPEEDVDLDSDKLTVDTHAFLKATLKDCRNDGNITAKNECAGGILGRSELGAAIGCVSKCKVETESGGKAGGIAGESSGSIENCAAQADLKGGDNLGGIAGQGKDITNCRAMTRVDSDGEKLGAIAGAASGTVSGNYYLNEDLAGVDGISYAGKSDGVDFATFGTLSGVPADFLTFAVSFVADGKTIAEIPVSYGGAVEESLIPEVPEAGGTYGSWEEFDRTDIVRSQTVHAVYDDLRSTISSPGRVPVLLAEGAFSPDAEIDVRTWSPDDSQIPSGYELVAAYAYDIEDDTPMPDTVTLHVAAGENGTDVAVIQNGEMQVIDSTLDGSYLICEGAPEGSLLVVRRNHTVLFVALGGAAVLIVLGLAFCIVRRRRRRKEAAAPDDIQNETEQTPNEEPQKME